MVPSQRIIPEHVRLERQSRFFNIKAAFNHQSVKISVKKVQNLSERRVFGCLSGPKKKQQFECLALTAGNERGSQMDEDLLTHT